MGPFISKHDKRAYTGKMDMLTFSRYLKYIHDEALEMMSEYREEPNTELINLRIQAKNETIMDVLKIIEAQAEDALEATGDNKRYIWNIK